MTAMTVTGLPSFQEVMSLTRTINIDILFSEEECRSYYGLCCSLPDCSSVLEIGMFVGRSTSIVLQVGISRSFLYTGVDPFIETGAQLPYFMEMLEKSRFPRDRFLHLRCKSEDADLTGPFQMALIDGNHDTEYVTADCLKVMPLIPAGGYICVHDYGRDSLIGVKLGTDATLGKDPAWRLLRVDGTLAIWQKQEKVAV